MKSKYIFPVRPQDWTEDGGLLSGSFIPGQNTTPFFMSDVVGQPSQYPYEAFGFLPPATWTTGSAPTVGGPQTGYWRMGPGARVKYSGYALTYPGPNTNSGGATEIEIECFATTTGNNTQIAVFVWDGTNFTPLFTPPCDNLGYNLFRLPLPAGANKNVEIIQSNQFSEAQEYLGYPPLGAYVTRIGFNVPMFVVPPTTPANHLLCEVDSIGCGGTVVCQAGFGVGGLMKRGLSVQSGAAWIGAYSSGTAYTVGQYVSYGVWVWKCIQNGTGQTPAVGSSYWSLWGYVGAVTLIGYGYKMVHDDWSTTGLANAAAAARAALGGTAMWWQTSSNDWVYDSVSTFTTNFARALAAMYTAQPSLPIFCMGMIQRGNPEVASGTGALPSAIRTAMSTAVSAASGTRTYASGAAWIPPVDYESTCTHPTTVAAQQLFMNTLQPYITT